MKSSCLTGIAVAVAACGLTCAAAFAQNQEEVQVQAARTVSTVVGRTTTGIPIVEVALSYRVSLAGLDLSTKPGADEAGRRVNAAAGKACKEIGRQYPNSTPSDSECARAASDKAMVRVHELVAAAQARPHG
jgi:UrcA family protein